MRISDWSSDVCSSDLPSEMQSVPMRRSISPSPAISSGRSLERGEKALRIELISERRPGKLDLFAPVPLTTARLMPSAERSEEHTSELQSLMRISDAVFCLKKKNTNIAQLQLSISIS